MLVLNSYAIFAFLVFGIPLLIIGAVIGACVGMAAAALLKNRLSGVAWDSAFGALGLGGTLVLVRLLPWPRNTVDIATGGKIVGSSTMSYYQGDLYPFALSVAVMLPLAHEVYRRWRRSNSD